MSSLFPLRSPVEQTRGEPQVLRVDEEAADAVFGALGSETARAIFAALYDEPRTASEVADAADTSLQNARYHLDKLVDADLVEVADTWYSERGTEMKVYASASDSVVVFAGEEEQRGRLRSAVERVLGGVAVVALLVLAGVAVDWLAAPTGGTPPSGRPSVDVHPENVGGEGVVEALPVVLTPGTLFVLGGLVALAAVVAVAAIQRWRATRG